MTSSWDCWPLPHSSLSSLLLMSAKLYCPRSMYTPTRVSNDEPQVLMTTLTGCNVRGKKSFS